MATGPRLARQKLIDVTRMEDTAVTMSRSAEMLFGYLSRLDALRDADLSREALAERAAEAELHTRVVLSAGMDALNELHDLGLLNDAPTDRDLEAVNKMKLTEAMDEVADVFRERMPAQRWDWLTTSSRLLEDVEVRVEPEDGRLRGIVTHGGQSAVVLFDPEAPATRVSTEAFFSAGTDRVYAPTSMMFASTDDAPGDVVAPYDATVGAMAWAREWMYRHARNAAELGPPARTGGGGVLAVISLIIIIALAVISVSVAILAIACAAGSDGACRLAAYLGLVAAALTAGKGKLDAYRTQQQQLSYGTNPQ